MLYTLGQYIVNVQSSTTSDGFSTIFIFGICNLHSCHFFKNNYMKMKIKCPLSIHSNGSSLPRDITHVGKVTVKRSAVVVRDVNIKEYTSCKTHTNTNKVAHSGFKSQRRRYQKSKQRVSMASKWTRVQQFFF